MMTRQSRQPASPIPTAAQLVLDFFDNELADVKFPEVDRQVLQDGAERVFALAEEVARAEATLEGAREALQQGVDQLVGRCGKALSYAKVYAEGDSDLLRRLEGVALPRPGRGRPGSGAAVAGTAASQGAEPARAGDEPAPRPAPRRGRRPAGASPLPPDSALFSETQQDDLPI